MSPINQDDALPVTVLLPDASALPITLYDGGAALRMAIVERDGVQALSSDWDRPGVYVLLDLHDQDGTWGCYAGKAAAGVRGRLMTHVAKKDHWRRALLIAKDTTFGFNSAQVGWLEGRLYDLLAAAEDARLHNANRPSDETLPPHERLALEAAVAPIRRVMRLIGYDPTSPDDSAPAGRATASSGSYTGGPAVPRTRTQKFFGMTVKDLLDAGLLHAGDTVTSTNGVWPATGTVLVDGSIEVDGTAHPAPSAAAYAVKNGNANGWDFWAVETPTGHVTLATLRTRYAEQRTTPTPPLDTAGPAT